MIFTTSSSELLGRLQKIGGAISSSPTMPSLEDFLFELNGDSLQITSSNLQTTMKTQTEVNSSDVGKFTIPAGLLMETLKALPDQPLRFSVDPDSFQVEITSSFGKYKMSGTDASEYPSLPTPDNSEKFSLSADLLKHSIESTSFATSTDELRQAMMGVLFHLFPDRIVFVATDAHKLVRYTHRGLDIGKEDSFIVPKKSLSLLLSILKNDGDVQIEYSSNHAYFEYDSTFISCRLVDARYPDYNAVIPTENPNELIAQRKDLLNCMKRISIFANKSTNQILFNMQEDSLTVSSRDLDFSNEANEQMVCSFDGEPMTMGFNAKMFLEMLGVIHTEEVHLHLSVPNRAGILVPSDNDDQRELLMLVMPVMMA